MTETRLDKIHIRDLQTRCIIGVYPEERGQPQDVVINLTLHADIRRAGRSDRIEDTVDYKAVKTAVIALTEQSSYFLIERLAEAVAQRCLKAGGVQKVEVTIDKPGALRYARSVAVEIVRERTGP